MRADANTVESNRYAPVHGYFSVLDMYRPVETNVARLQKEGGKTILFIFCFKSFDA